MHKEAARCPDLAAYRFLSNKRYGPAMNMEDCNIHAYACMHMQSKRCTVFDIRFNIYCIKTYFFSFF